MGLGKINMSQLPFLAHLLQIHTVLAETVVIADRQLLSRAFGRFNHFSGIGRRLSHRFLAHNMLSGFQRCYGNISMGFIWSKHMHDIKRAILQQLMIVCVNLGSLNAVFSCGFFRAFRDNVAKCN
ncbi:hypothetical protein D3C77_639900 [compost metagenome]